MKLKNKIGEESETEKENWEEILDKEDYSKKEHFMRRTRANCLKRKKMNAEIRERNGVRTTKIKLSQWVLLM